MYLPGALGCWAIVTLRSKTLSEEEGAIDPDKKQEEGYTHTAMKDCNELLHWSHQG